MQAKSVVGVVLEAPEPVKEEVQSLLGVFGGKKVNMLCWKPTSVFWNSSCLETVRVWQWLQDFLKQQPTNDDEEEARLSRSSSIVFDV